MPEYQNNRPFDPTRGLAPQSEMAEFDDERPLRTEQGPQAHACEPRTGAKNQNGFAVACHKAGRWRMSGLVCEAGAEEVDQEGGRRVAGNRDRCIHRAVSVVPSVGNGGGASLRDAIRRPASGQTLLSSARDAGPAPGAVGSCGGGRPAGPWLPARTGIPRLD